MRGSLANKVNTNEVIYVALLFYIISTHVHPHSVDSLYLKDNLHTVRAYHKIYLFTKAFGIEL